MESTLELTNDSAEKNVAELSAALKNLKPEEKILIKAKGDFSKHQLQSYQDKMEQHFGKRQPIAGIMERMPDKVRIQLASQLLTTKWFAKHVVMDRWFLHQNQAPVGLQ